MLKIFVTLNTKVSNAISKIKFFKVVWEIKQNCHIVRHNKFSQSCICQTTS